MRPRSAARWATPRGSPGRLRVVLETRLSTGLVTTRHSLSCLDSPRCGSGGNSPLLFRARRKSKVVPDVQCPPTEPGVLMDDRLHPRVAGQQRRCDLPFVVQPAQELEFVVVQRQDHREPFPTSGHELLGPRSDLFDKWRLFLLRRVLIRLGYTGEVESPHKGYASTLRRRRFLRRAQRLHPLPTRVARILGLISPRSSGRSDRARRRARVRITRTRSGTEREGRVKLAAA